MIALSSRGCPMTGPRAELNTLSYAAYLGRLAALEQALRANGQWFFPHPWLTTFVGDAAVESTVGRELALLSPADLGPFGQVVLSAFRREAVTSPLLRLPGDDLVYAFNIVRIPPTDDRDEADRLVAANRATYERLRQRGARFTRSVRSRCLVGTGAGTSGQSSDSCATPSGPTTRGTSSRPAMRSLPLVDRRRAFSRRRSVRL